MLGRRRIVDAVNKLSMTEETRILGLLLSGWSDRRIARETGSHRATIARLRRQAGLAPPKCTILTKVPTDPKPHSGPEVPTGSEVPTGFGGDAQQR